MSAPILDLMALVQERLAVVAPSFEGEAALSHLDSPPRYVWVFVDATSKQLGTGTTQGPSVRQMAWDVWRVEVHAWGVDLPAALELRRCLVKVLQDTVGNRFKLGRTRRVGGKEYGAHGDVIISEVHLPAPLLDGAILPEQPEPAGSRAETGTAVALDTIFDVPIGTSGDGGLTTGED